MSTPIIASFHNPNTPTTLPTTETGQTWTIAPVDAVYGINNLQAVLTIPSIIGTLSFALIDAGQTDMEMSCTVKTPHEGWGLCIKYTDSTHYLILNISGGILTLANNVGAGIVTLRTYTGPMSSEDKITIVTSLNQIYVKLNNIYIMEASINPSLIAGTLVGLAAYMTAGPVLAGWSNFSVTNYSFHQQPVLQKVKNVSVSRRKDYSILTWDRVTQDINGNYGFPIAYNIYKTFSSNGLNQRLVSSITTTLGGTTTDGQFWINTGGTFTIQTGAGFPFQTFNYTGSESNGENLPDVNAVFNNYLPWNTLFLFFVSCQFFNKSLGYFSGNNYGVVGTIDGGDTITVKTKSQLSPLNKTFFIDPLNGWAVGGNRVSKTTDGGNTWTLSATLASTLSSIYFTDINTGWICGTGGSMYHTSDGGASWGSQVTGTLSPLAWVCFRTPLMGLSVGTGGIIIKTIDGGATWTTIVVPGVSTLLNCVSWDRNTTQTNTAYICGVNSIILKTTDGGDTWRILDAGIGGTTTLESVSFITPLIGWVVGQNKIVKTLDGGNSWVIQNANLSSSDFLFSISAIDVDTAFIAGNELILKTTDGGSTWSKLQSNFQNLNGSGFTSIDSTQILAVKFTPTKTNLSQVIIYTGSNGSSPVLPANIIFTCSILQGTDPNTATVVSTTTTNSLINSQSPTKVVFNFNPVVKVSPGLSYFFTISHIYNVSPLRFLTFGSVSLGKLYPGTIENVFVDTQNIDTPTSWYYTVTAVNCINQESDPSEIASNSYFKTPITTSPDLISAQAKNILYWDIGKWDEDVWGA